MKIDFTANSKGKPPAFAPILATKRRKLADCEIHFTEGEPLAGYKLWGFVVWERVEALGDLKVGNLSVSGPDFMDPTPGINKSYSLLKPIGEDEYTHDCLKGELSKTIITAFRAWQKKQNSIGEKIRRAIGAEAK